MSFLAAMLMGLPATAAPTLGNVDLQASFLDTESAAPAVGGGIGIFVEPAVLLDGQASVSPFGFGADFMLGARGFPMGRTDGSGLGLGLHGGLALRDGLSPVVGGSVFADLPSAGSPALRAQLQYLIHSDGVGQARLSIGLLWGPRSDEVVPEVATNPVVEDPERVFVTYPVCEWTAVDELKAVSQILAERPTMVEKAKQMPAKLADVLRADFEHTEARIQGSLVISAMPSDSVTVDGRALALDDEGFAVLTVGERPHEIRVVGGGRVDQRTVGIVDGYGVWVVASEPPEQLVLFDVGGDVLSSSAATQIADIAAVAGEWSFEIRGSFSAEGDLVANRALANRRAESVGSALQQAGVAKERLTVLTAAESPKGLTPAQQRNATIRPFAAEGKR